MHDDYISFSNLYHGLKRSCRNVRWKTSVTQYEMNGLKNTAKLIRQIKSGEYQISKYQVFEIFEPKRRTIRATQIKDRQLQRSLCDNVLYNALTRSFIYDNCACQIGKGTLFAVNRLKTKLHQYYRSQRTADGYYLKCDIRHFFDSIRHDVAKAAVRKRVQSDDVCERVFDIIDSFDGKVGIGLGSQVSQLVALSVLDDMDHIIKEQLGIKGYIRYMDDFVLIHHDKQHLKNCLQVIREHLASIGLELNEKTSIQPLRHGLTFLHWRFYLSQTGAVCMTQAKDRVRRRHRHLSKMLAAVRAGALPVSAINDAIAGMIAHINHGKCYHERKKLNEYIV